MNIKSIMNIKNYLNILKNRQSSAGFTITEMVFAGCLGVVVLAAAAVATALVAEDSKTASATIKIEEEMNRALDFMSTEIKKAETIEKGVVVSDLATLAADFTLPSGAIPVLALKMPKIDQTFIYYVADKPNGSKWVGPKIIYRWGPDFNINGKYTNSNSPVSWKSIPLIDEIDDTALDVNWSCPSGSSLSFDGVSNNTNGFYSCVNNNGKMAQLYLNGKVNTVHRKTKKIKKDSKIFARAEVGPPKAPTPPALTSTAIPTWELIDGILTSHVPLNLTFQVLGGDSACTPSKPFVVSTELFFNGSDQGVSLTSGQSISLPAGSATDVVVQSTKNGGGHTYPGWCQVDKVIQSTNTNQRVLALRNGDTIPSYAPLWNQGSIESFLQGYLNNGVVSIGDNQVIYLFELAYNTSPGSSSYDLQDNVVLVTVNP